MTDKRVIEATIFASATPVDERDLAPLLSEGADLAAILDALQADYADRGVNLVRRDGKWAFRTALDLAGRLAVEKVEVRKLSRAAVEVLAIIAYYQPVTRAEIEDIRGVGLSKGSLDVLFQAGWIKPRGRRRTAGRPVQWGTAEGFLDHFGLQSLDDLPDLKELKAAGLLDMRIDAGSYANRAALGEVSVDMDDGPVSDSDLGNDEPDLFDLPDDAGII